MMSSKPKESERMKTLLVATTLAALTVASQAQAWGYNTFNATPNAYGGYNYTNQFGSPLGSSTPNAYGGYNYTNPYGGQIGSSTPNAYGGYTFHYGY
jgi:hypothetical protein